MLTSALIEINGELELNSKGKKPLAKLWFMVENGRRKILSVLHLKRSQYFSRAIASDSGKMCKNNEHQLTTAAPDCFGSTAND